MPELPEVYAMATALETVTGFECIVATDKDLVGAKIVSTGYIGKYLAIKFSNEYIFIAHFALNGWMYVDDGSYSRQDGDMFYIQLSNNITLRFNDYQHWGKCWVIAPGGRCTALEGLGYNPETITVEELGRITHTSTAIKTVITNQKLISGIGNMYADEILFAAAISPDLPACMLTHDRLCALRDAIIKILAEAKYENKVTLSQYALVGKHRLASRFLTKCYNREGKPCCICGGRIIKTQLNSRSTYYCDKHQKRALSSAL